MNLNLNKHLPNREKINDGVWVEIYPNIKFLLAHAGISNKKFQSLIMETNLISLLDGKGDMDMTQDLNLVQDKLYDLYAKTIVKGWRGLKDDKTNENYPYTQENCLKLFKEYPELFQKISKEAGDQSNYIGNVETLKKK